MVAVTVSVDEFPALIEAGLADSVTNGFGLWSSVKTEQPVRTGRKISERLKGRVRLMSGVEDSLGKVNSLNLVPGARDGRALR